MEANYYSTLKHLNYIGSFDFTGVDFSNENLHKKNLYGSNCSYANFKNAKLIETCLSNCDCSYADFRGADLTGADLSNSVFKGAKFAEAKIAHIRFSSEVKTTFFHEQWCDDKQRQTRATTFIKDDKNIVIVSGYDIFTNLDKFVAFNGNAAYLEMIEKFLNN